MDTTTISSTITTKDTEGALTPVGEVNPPSEADKSQEKGEPTIAGTEKPKTRKYTTAERRKYKKELLRAQKAQGGPTSNTPTGEEVKAGGGAGNGRKRPGPVHNTPSPNTQRPEKRTKTGEGATMGYSAATNSKIVKFAIAPMNYPDEVFTPGDIEEIKSLLISLILEIPKGGKAPIFEGVWEREGAALVGCPDEETVTWLKSLFPDRKIGGKEVRVMPSTELPKRHRIVVHIERANLETSQALILLDRQNPELGAENWIIVRGSESGDAKSVHFSALIGDKPLEALKSCGFKPYCGFLRASVKLLGKKTGEKQPSPQ